MTVRVFFNEQIRDTSGPFSASYEGITYEDTEGATDYRVDEENALHLGNVKSKTVFSNQITTAPAFTDFRKFKTYAPYTWHAVEVLDAENAV